MNYLKGKKFLITKSAEDCASVFSNLTITGAEIIYFPTIKIIPTYNSLDLTQLISGSVHYDYIIFTSPNSVEVFAELADEYKPDFSRTKVAAVGSGTADLCREHGIAIHLIPQEFSGKGLVKKFSEIDIKDKKILLPVSSIAGKDLELGLAGLGAMVTRLNIYDTITCDADELRDELNYVIKNKPDLFAFTSPSSYRAFIKILNLEDYQSYFQDKIICAIGTTTEESIRNSGVVVNIVPNVFSLRGISEAISIYFSKSFNIA